MIKDLTFMTFWAINDVLDIKKMRVQLEEMKALGFDGTIFQPRNYPGRPGYLGSEYLDILSEIIIYAKELELVFWIYDENGWPSGTADGKVMEQFPDSRCQWLELGKDGVKCKEKGGFNTLNREEMQYFVEVTYDGYRRGLSGEAWEHVTGFFSDEVGFLDGHGAASLGGVPWCEEIGERFLHMYGMDASKSWHLLFLEDEGYETYRSHYWEILTDILAESFYAEIGTWCLKHGKRYTAHLKGEENLFFQVPYSGSAFQNLKHVNLPAVDALERFPGNHYFPRIASSVSRQFSDGECLVEAIGGSGWGLTPEQFEHYVEWLAKCGITQYVFHLSQYTLNSSAVRDWPPSLPFGMNWKGAFRPMLERLRLRYGKVARMDNRLLLIAPVRGVMRTFQPVDSMAINEHNGEGTPTTESGLLSLSFEHFVEHCDQMGLEFDVTEERILETFGVVEDGMLRLGHAEYDVVAAGKGCCWEDDTLWRELRAKGRGLEAKELKWNYIKAGLNQILLSWESSFKESDSRILVCEVETNFHKIHGELRISILDEVSEVRIGGHICDLYSVEECGIDRFLAVIPEALPEDNQRKITIEITTLPYGEQEPFAWLQGDFLVKSHTGYRKKDSHQVMTEGGFYLIDEDSSAVSTEDLLFAGYPFMGNSITVACKVVVSKSGSISLGTVYADAVFVRVDGIEYGYVWGPKYRLYGLKPGIHTIEADLYPSTFNTYGPHHHVDGDRHLVSPYQYSGQKCFADFPDSPEYTLVPRWHLVKLGID